jgi:hypothetical protein
MSKLNKILSAVSAAYGVAASAVLRVGKQADRELHKRLGSARAAGRVKRWGAAMGVAAVFIATAGLAPGVAHAMADFNVWSNTNIDIQTNSTVAAQAISSISKSNPAVVTYAGTDPANGDYIKITGVVGMIEVNDQVFRVANVNAGSNTLELEDIDSTGFTTFVSGNMFPIVFGVSMTTVQDVNSGGGEFQFTDITTIHDALQKRIPTVSSPFSMQLGCLFKPSDAAHVELNLANRTKTPRAIRIRFATGDQAAWLAYVGASGIPTGAAQQVVKTNVSFEGQGTPNFYPA